MSLLMRSAIHTDSGPTVDFMQYNPIYEFRSQRAGITLQLTDSYNVRSEILTQLQKNATTWFELALGRAPVELQSTLQVCQFIYLCNNVNTFYRNT